MTRVLLTGAQGALGWYIKEYLSHSKQIETCELACISRREISEPGVKNYRCDLLDKDKVGAIIEDFKPQKALLVAWETTHGSYWHDSDNIKWADATIAFAEKFAEQGGDFLSFAGTCAEYQWSSSKMVEDKSPQVPATLYGKEKLRTTRHLLDMRKQGKLDANCCRLFFPFSDRENENRVTSLVLKSALENKPIHLRSGDVYRDICHARHIGAAMCDMMFAGAGGLINMSIDEPLHLGTFLKMIAGRLDKEHLVSWDRWDDNHASGGEPRYLYGSNEKVKPYLDRHFDLQNAIQSFVDAGIKRYNR